MIESQMDRDTVNLAERLIAQAKKAAELIKDEISVLCQSRFSHMSAGWAVKPKTTISHRIWS